MNTITKSKAFIYTNNPYSKSMIRLCIILFSLIIFTASCRKNDLNSRPPQTYDLKLIADNLVSPITLAGSPDQTKRLFIVDQVGKIWIIGADGIKLPNPFIDKR